MWAHLVQMGKHSLLDEPPYKSFFRGRKRPNNEHSTPSCTKTRMVSNSLGRKCRLEKWNQLCTSSVIDESEYQELTKMIITDIKDL